MCWFIDRTQCSFVVAGMCSATLCPSVSLYLAAHGQSKAYCGTGRASPVPRFACPCVLCGPCTHCCWVCVFHRAANGEYGFLYHLVSFLIVWLAVDFWGEPACFASSLALRLDGDQQSCGACLLFCRVLLSSHGPHHRDWLEAAPLAPPLLQPVALCGHC